LTCYLDTSALVKLYADEDDHAIVRSLTGLVVSQLARVEVPAALWRKQRLGELDPQHVHVLLADFEADYFGAADELPRLAVVATTGPVLDVAARVTGVHALRAYDAVHLATAISVRQADPECGAFVAFDGQLRAAAAAEGFALVP
jgi:predicted nucleic acid-binding protein